ncbi:MAG: SPFH domain-containing protein [Lentisphaeraceae bacterium]|nr:SPFH domain-containing protein [Lentisphaeraceae bacterium]
MKAVKIISILVILGITGFWTFIMTCTIKIPMGKAGVRINEYGVLGTKGIEDKTFGPGWHRDLGPLESWLIYDTTVQTLELTKNPNFGDRAGVDDLKIQAKGGLTVSCDITLKYRIAPGKAHQMLKQLGAGNKYKTTVRTQTENTCIAVLGKMTPVEFYKPKIRLAVTAEAKKELVANLGKHHIEVIDLLIRDITFSDQLEEKILREKIATQEVLLNQFENLAEQERGKVAEIEAQTRKLVAIIKQELNAEKITLQATTDAKIAKIVANAKLYSTKKEAEADLVADQSKAKGQLLIKKAEAAGEKLRNDAMRGVGGSTIVALEAARNINLSNITVSTVDIDFLDLNAMAERFGVVIEKKEEEKK